AGNYNELVRKARERMRLTQEELGKKINEKTSVITRIESGKMIPDDKLARKLENFLNIKILQKADDELVGHTSAAGKELTIGDIIKIKRKIK
ncbi:MAG: multiprotein-bridging factor 1 family protein, partial [Candidatus Hydrothermarchaeaceae archaeon]